MAADDLRQDLVTETHAGGAHSAEGAGGDGERVYLLVRRGADANVTQLARGASLTMGRGRSCDVPLADTKASREHCRVEHRSEGVFLRDLGSHNGTWLRGRKLPPSVDVPVQAGDVFSIGAIEAVVAVATPFAERADEGAAVDAGETFEAGEAIVADPATVHVHRLARRVASAPTTVLIHGETGSGKEVLAERVHRMSPRADKPFVRVNCAAIPEALIESELFGHERGAFTGADKRKQGLFVVADGGTVLLDEIGELSLAMQAKLLRVLETKEVQPVGATAPTPVDVRFVCATHRDLRAAVAAKAFREDLYYRISAFVLTLPPLRERPLELALLCEHFVRTFASRQATPAPRLSHDVLALLKSYPWPGNVRELRNVIEYAVVLCDGPSIEVRHLPAALTPSIPRADRDKVPPAGVRQELDDLERERIASALAAHAGNRTHASQALGMSRRALIYKLHKYGLG